jgi:hypothetical protein
MTSCGTEMTQEPNAPAADASKGPTPRLSASGPENSNLNGPHEYCKHARCCTPSYHNNALAPTTS